MRLISDEGRALMIEDKAGRLSTGRESDLHLAFGCYMIDVTARRV